MVIKSMVKENNMGLFKIKSGMDFLDTSSENISEDEVLDYLARIIANTYLAGYPNATKEDEELTQL